MNKNFEYSVLMSVYKKDNPIWLKISIDSMLNQTIKTNDFVLIEDGELGKELEEVILEYEKKYSDIFHVIRNAENKGLGLALAQGVLAAKNEWIARMDSDDYSKKDRIEKQLSIIENANGNIDIIGSNIAEFMNDIENIISYRALPESDEEIKRFAKRRNPFGHPSVMLKKSTVLKAGNFRTYYLCEDYDMWIRMFQKNAKGYNIQEDLVCMRISDDFYKRRGGIKYLKSILKFKTEQLKNGFYGFTDFFISSLASIITCMLPNVIRDYIYKNFLRNKYKDD